MSSRKKNRKSDNTRRSAPKKQLKASTHKDAAVKKQGLLEYSYWTEDDLVIPRPEDMDEETQERRKPRTAGMAREPKPVIRHKDYDRAWNAHLVITALASSDMEELSSRLEGSSLYRRIQELACHDCKCHHGNICGDKGLEACPYIDPAPLWLDCYASLDSFDLYYSGMMLSGELPEPEENKPWSEPWWG